MKDSKLIATFKTLNDEELRQLYKFIHSPLFNQHKQVIQLFNLIRIKLRNKTFKLDKSTAFNQIFPGQSYDDKKIRNIMSYLFQVLESFLAYLNLHRLKSSELIELAKSYRTRQLWKQFDATAKQSTIALNHAPIKDVSFHYQNYQLEQEKYYASIDKKRTTETNLQAVTDSLDISYFANRLKQTCSMLSHRNVYKAEYDFGIINEIIKEVNRKQLYKIPAIGIYYYVYLALTETDNKQHFKQLQKELIANSHLFTKEEMRDIYLLGVNIGIRYINKNIYDLLSETLEIYKNGVEKGYLLTNGQISRFTFKNAVSIGLRLERHDWVKQFIEQYKDLLDPNYKEETHCYNLAKLKYSTRKYDEALQLLKKNALSDDVYVNLDTKILLAKVYYELEDFDAIESLISSFQAFIRRKQAISYQRSNYQNFINALRKLVNLNQFDKAARNTLTDDLKALNPLPEKYWFLKQLG